MEVTALKDSQLAQNPVIAQMMQNNHEQIVFCNDNETGLKAIIAIHNTVLGPALGGTRMWNYTNEMEAITDVLRLSRGMTYKSSLAGLNLGGGKAVIIGDSKTQKNEALMRRFGKFVNSLAGKYITAEDVGISTQDMVYVKMETDSVTGIPESMGGSGDPSPVTAFGVYMGMKACASKRWGSDSLVDKKVAVQGIGNVGQNLVKYLTKEGAKVYINDINEERLQALSKETGAKVVLGDAIYGIDMDIYAPCALGATINDDTLNRLKCSIIAGAANNQLLDENVHGLAVMEKGLLYAPDFMINAGGIINVYSELTGYNRDNAMRQAQNIYNTTLKIFDAAAAQSITTHEAAKRLAIKRIDDIAKIRAVR